MNAEGTASSPTQPSRCFHWRRGYGETPQPCVAPRLDDRAYGLGLLGVLAAVRPTAVLALLLVGRGKESVTRT